MCECGVRADGTVVTCGDLLKELLTEAEARGRNMAVDYIEQAFSETRPKTELNISKLFREARSHTGT